MVHHNNLREDDVRSYYRNEKVRLEQAIRTGKRLLAETQFNTTADREAHEKELESREEELRWLDERKEMAVKAVWSTFRGLWPIVREMPMHYEPRGG